MQKTIDALFTLGDVDENRLSYLPADYAEYDITLETFVAGDVDAIKQWPTTARITIVFTHELSEEAKSFAEEILKSHNIEMPIYE